MWKITGIRRLAIALSAIWILTFYFFSEKELAQRIFRLPGLLSVFIGWLILWIFKGSKNKNRERKSTGAFV